MAQAVTKRDHFDVLIVCPSQDELDVAEAVLEYDTESKFLPCQFSHLPYAGRVCKEWSSSALTVALIAQREPGGNECCGLVKDMASLVTVELVAMIGICSGKEDVLFHVDHGNVVVATTAKIIECQTDLEEESVSAATEIGLDSPYLIKLIEELACDDRKPWNNFIPDKYNCPSHKSAEELLLQELRETKLEKETLLKRLTEKSSVSQLTWSKLLDRMVNVGPDWIRRIVDKETTSYAITAKGMSHIEDASGAFRCRHSSEVLVGCIGTPRATVNADTDEALKHLKSYIPKIKVLGLDLESYHLMNETRVNFTSSRFVVIRGLSWEYNSRRDSLDTFQSYAAAAATAVLRCLMEQGTSSLKDVAVSDGLSILDTEAKTKQDRSAPFSSVSTVVGAGGGKCKLEDVILTVPPGAVSSPTSISVSVYENRSVLLSTDVEDGTVLSPVVQLSPQDLQFKSPVNLSFLPNVSLKSKSVNEGHRLELKMTDTFSAYESSRQWYTVLAIDTVRDEVTERYPHVRFDAKSQEVQLQHLGSFVWVGKLLDDASKFQCIVYGKKMDTDSLNIFVHTFDKKKSTSKRIAATMKEKDYIALCDPTDVTIDIFGEIEYTLGNASISKPKQSVLKEYYSSTLEQSFMTESFSEWKVKAEDLIEKHETTYSENIKSFSQLFKPSKLCVLKVSCARHKKEEKPSSFPTPSFLVLDPEKASQIEKRDHFQCLVVCARKFELQAARRVFENSTNSKFERAYLDLPFTIHLCKDWISPSSTRVALVTHQQPEVSEHMDLLSRLSSYFSADLIALVGACAGKEDQYGLIGHGSVVVARRTAAVSGQPNDDGEFPPLTYSQELDRNLKSLVRQLVADTGKEWVKYVPKTARCYSPRYIQELVLQEVRRNSSSPNGIEKAKLVDWFERQQFRGMTKIKFDELLYKMMKHANPWLQAVDTVDDMLTITAVGEQFTNDAVVFPRKDKINVVFESMVTVPQCHDSDILDIDMEALRRQTEDRSSTVSDNESHYFMQQVSESFSPGVGIVMKGIADYGTNTINMDYYLETATSTAVAFLRHLLIKRLGLDDQFQDHVGDTWGIEESQERTGRLSACEMNYPCAVLVEPKCDTTARSLLQLLQSVMRVDLLHPLSPSSSYILSYWLKMNWWNLQSYVSSALHWPSNIPLPLYRDSQKLLASISQRLLDAQFAQECAGECECHREESQQSVSSDAYAVGTGWGNTEALVRLKGQVPKGFTLQFPIGKRQGSFVIWQEQERNESDEQTICSERLLKSFFFTLEDIVWVHLFAEFLKEFATETFFVAVKDNVTIAEGEVTLTEPCTRSTPTVVWKFRPNGQSQQLDRISACPRDMLEQLGRSHDDTDVLYSRGRLSKERLLKLFLKEKCRHLESRRCILRAIALHDITRHGAVQENHVCLSRLFIAVFVQSPACCYDSLYGFPIRKYNVDLRRFDQEYDWIQTPSELRKLRLSRDDADEITSEIAKTHIGLLSNHSNLVAISPGYKVEKRLRTNKLSAKIHVLLKGAVPIGESLIPKFIGNSIPTDVCEGFVCLSRGPFTNSCLNPTLGASIDIERGYSVGSVGGVLVDNEDPDKRYLLSNEHVLNPDIDDDPSSGARFIVHPSECDVDTTWRDTVLSPLFKTARDFIGHLDNFCKKAHHLMNQGFDNSIESSQCLFRVANALRQRMGLAVQERDESDSSTDDVFQSHDFIQSNVKEMKERSGLTLFCDIWNVMEKCNKEGNYSTLKDNLENLRPATNSSLTRLFEDCITELTEQTVKRDARHAYSSLLPKLSGIVDTRYLENNLKRILSKTESEVELKEDAYVFKQFFTKFEESLKALKAATQHPKPPDSTCVAVYVKGIKDNIKVQGEVGMPFYVDVALAALQSKWSISDSVSFNDDPKFEFSTNLSGEVKSAFDIRRRYGEEEVYKCGRTTGLTKGRICLGSLFALEARRVSKFDGPIKAMFWPLSREDALAAHHKPHESMETLSIDPAATKSVYFPEEPSDQKWRENMVVIEPALPSESFSEPGDSGSLVFDKDGHALGLVVSLLYYYEEPYPKRTLMCPLEPALQLLQRNLDGRDRTLRLLQSTRH